VVDWCWNTIRDDNAFYYSILVLEVEKEDAQEKWSFGTPNNDKE
jgi:hypothetical protein